MLAEAVSGLPEPRLRPYVDRYLGYREQGGMPLVRREAAGAFVVLVLGWGARLDVIDPRRADRAAYGVDSFVAGPYDGYCTTRTAGAGAGVQLVLTPPAARRVLGLPLGELANRAVATDRLAEGWLGRLRDRLAGAADWPARFALLDAALADRLAVAGPLDPRLAGAWRLLARSGGRCGVGALAEEVGWSRRHLAVRFREEIGLPPKTVARLLRFQGTCAALGRVPGSGRADGAIPEVGWADLAVRFGYYDQSHLIRDFREFTGATPTALRSHSSNCR